MATERPKYCEIVECPNYQSNRDCTLYAWVRRGWVRVASRREQDRKWVKMADEEPRQVVNECNNKLVR